MVLVTPWLFSVLSCLVSIYFVRKFMRKYPKNNFQLPPGSQQLPFIGNLHQLVTRKMLPHRRLQELARVYGPIMHLRLGETSTVVVSSAEGAREVFKTNDINLVGRPKLMVGKILFYGSSDIALSPYGEYWRQLRKIATLGLLTQERVQLSKHIREEEVSKFIKSLASAAASGSVIDLSDKLFNLMFSITSRIVFNKEGQGQSTFKVLVTTIADAISGLYVADLYPSIKWLYSVSGSRRKFEEMVKESNRMLDPIINEHISKKKQGKTDEEDLVDVLLKFHEDNLDADSDLSFSLTTNNIKAVLLDIFTAGSEPSVTTIEWAMSELLRNPKMMERAQAEVRKVCEGKGTVDESSLNELKFLKFVTRETLRLHFVAPLLVPKESIEHCQIGGYDIPPKTRVLVNAWAIARDPKYWINPDLFKPERIEGSSIDYKGTNFEYIPFGARKRVCPGITLGMLNVEFLLAMLLYHFDWKLSAGLKPEDLDMDEVCGASLRRKKPLRVIPVPYKSSNII